MVLHVHVCTLLVSGPHRGQKKAWSPLELELPIVVSYPVGAKNGRQVLCKSNQCH